MKNTWFGVTSSLAVLAVLAASPAFAQDQVPDQTEAEKSQTGVTDIVVTANRREQNLQDVGISIAAFTGEQLDDLQVTNAGDVAALTPNVEIVRSYASPGFNTQITIRGVGQPDFQDTTEAVVTSYVDEFYMVGAGQADFLAFDVARVEVARGPQGTVQGRNSTAGCVARGVGVPTSFRRWLRWGRRLVGHRHGKRRRCDLARGCSFRMLSASGTRRPIIFIK